MSAPEPASRPFAIARRFSLHVEGMPLLYNLLLAERCQEREDGRGELIDDYRGRIGEWAQREAEEGPYEAEALWLFLSPNRRTPVRRLPQKNFVEELGREGQSDPMPTL